MKVCIKCGVSKPLIEFGTRTRNSHGKRGRCKECEKADRKVYFSTPGAEEKSRAAAKQWYWKNREASIARQAKWVREHQDHVLAYRRRKLLEKYGITPQEYDKLLAEQDGRCKICASAKPGPFERNFYVDHCHETGKVRGLLCGSCNLAIGQFDDNPGTLRRAALYVELHGGI